MDLRFSAALKYAMYLFGILSLDQKGIGFVRQHFKHQQIRAIWAVANRKDVLVVLPTGFGKSLIFQVLPFVMEFMLRGDLSEPFKILPQHLTCIIFSPLIALMEDQVMTMSKIGVVAARWSAENNCLVQLIAGKPALIYVSPEAFLNTEALQILIKNCNICCLVVDEAHCIVSWGQEFRPAYHEIGDIRALFPSVPILALTATATFAVKSEIIKYLHLFDFKLIEEPPILENLFLVVQKKEKWGEFLEKCLRELKCERKETPRRIFFCQTQIQAGELFAQFQDEFEELQYEGGQPQIKHRLFAMFHSDTLEEIKTEILATLKDPASDLRYVFATIAFGLGVNCLFREVVHLGSPRKLDDYVQQIGRAGRDGKEAIATLFWDGHDLKYAEEAMKSYCSDQTCKREIIAKHFDSTRKSSVGLCCSICPNVA
eukprot:Pompholyxophrys_punicea_v1_NODE_495_length_1840_cov_5.228571.p1 type:complete len:429 gc:universal NODE_495_length_1840_cov_5.228571:472-1758(+)